MIRLIACDIDGTLLLNGASAIDPAIFAHIRRLREKGVLFCPASGRQYSSLRGLFQPMADELYYLCENGAAVFGPGCPGPVLGKTVMPWSRALELCREILALPRCEVMISGENTSYLCPKQADIIDHVRYFVGNRVATLGAPEDMPEEILKVSAYCRDGAAGVEPLLAPRWLGEFTCAIGGEKWLDFALADKGIGLGQLCASLGLSADEVAAFGDNYNDLPMLRAVGMPYVMATAPQPLLQEFPRHCRRVDEVLRTL